MPRAHVYKVIQNADGSVLLGATVRVLVDGTLTVLPDTLYTSDAGVAIKTNPFVSDTGVIEFYLANPQRVQVGVTPPGGAEFFITTDAEPDARNVVVSSVPVSLGTPVPGTYLHVNPTGQFEYVGSDPTSGSTAPPQVFLKDSANQVWSLAIDTSGHLTVTSQGATSQTALNALYLRDTAGAAWSVTVSTDGHLITGSA